MFKKILTISIVLSITMSNLFANTGEKPSELMYLPHPVKVIIPNIKKLEITKKQELRLQQEMLEVYPKIIQSKLQEIGKLEKKIKMAVLQKNKTKEDLKSKIDVLEKKKREVTDVHIDALNTLASILTPEQMKKSLDLMNKKRKVNKKFKIDELVILPHPGKLIKTGKINASMDQKQRISKEVKTIYPPVFQDLIRKAFDLEKKVQRAVKKGKNKDELKDLLDEIAKLKREAMNSRIDALNHIQKILTKEQWKKVNKLTYN